MRTLHRRLNWREKSKLGESMQQYGRASEMWRTVAIVLFLLSSLSPIVRVGFAGLSRSEMIGIAILFLLIASFAWWQYLKSIKPMLLRTAAQFGICGQCGYGLIEIEAEEDGCVVCPECGAAWRLSVDSVDA